MCPYLAIPSPDLGDNFSLLPCEPVMQRPDVLCLGSVRCIRISQSICRRSPWVDGCLSPALSIEVCCLHCKSPVELDHIPLTLLFLSQASAVAKTACYHDQ